MAFCAVHPDYSLILATSPEQDEADVARAQQQVAGARDGGAAAADSLLSSVRTGFTSWVVDPLSSALDSPAAALSRGTKTGNWMQGAGAWFSGQGRVPEGEGKEAARRGAAWLSHGALAACYSLSNSALAISWRVCTLDCFDRWQASCQSISALPCRLLRRTLRPRCARLVWDEMLAMSLPLE